MRTSENKIKLSHMSYIVVFIGLLLVVRWGWHNHFSLSNPPTVKQGVLDLRGVDIESLSSFPLDGEWEFYPEQWVNATNIDNATKGQRLQVPGNWTAKFNPADQEQAYGYGTYHLRILLNQPLSEPLSFWFQSVYTASEVEINGRVLSRFGKLSEEKEGHVSVAKSFLISYAPTDQNQMDLFVRASNYGSPLKGGIVRSVEFGIQHEVDTIYWNSIGLQLIVVVILLLHGLYLLIIYLMDVRKTELIIFFLMLVTAAMTVGVKHNGLLFRFLQVDFGWTLKLKALSFIGFCLFLFLMGRELLGNQRNGKAFYSYILIVLGYTLYIVVGPEENVLYSIEKGFYKILYYVPLFWTAYYFAKMVFLRAEGALFLLCSVLAVINNMLWGSVYYAGTSQFMFYPVDMIAALVTFSAYWFRRYFHQSHQNVLLNAQLAEANKLKDRFLANTSHELRTPLHGIMNIAQSVLTRKKHVLDEESQRDMELLIMVSRRMSLMLNDLLDVVRLQDKQIVMNIKAVQVRSLAEGVLDMLRFLTGGTKVELSMHINEDLPRVYADGERLVQILINLVHNALKYTEEGSVELSTEQVGEYVWIHVTDTGLGMDEDLKKRVFMRYEQGAYGEGGIGLGLSICKELIELHDSELLLQSQPGQGSKFSFKLPVVNESVQAFIPDAQLEKDTETLSPFSAWITAETSTMVAATYSTKEVEPLSKLDTDSDFIRVLAVDDDSVNLKVLQNILSEGTYQIVTTTSASEALDKLNHDRFDLIIADVMMPGMSGYELTRLIRERFTMFELPIILLTARSEREDIYAGFLAGANDYVTKPVDAMELKYRALSLSSMKRAVNDRLRMEGAYLQAQIHPHFLFNTLNSIMSLSDFDTAKMRELSDAFTTYLRISFDFLNAGKLVTLSQELELVENYVYIQQQRFEERLNVEWEVDANLEMLIPPLTLQPLVENAVRHGVLSRAKGGTLRIHIETRADAVHFNVADTGMGMDKAQVSELLNPKGHKNQGIGLLNTDRRLTQLYGRGLQIQSIPGVGTTVSFIIPD
ncbi:ATP-binding protein [Paenibacillus sp.]|uniref:ATP-binding protein n=1 Tax=Paenibacillus sp. TaxID=58172 RepID=UPI0028AF2686|nr:ATP-binding protein [Paenibacillus sp.]